MNRMDLIADGALTDSCKSQFKLGHDTLELTFVMPRGTSAPFPHPDLLIDEFANLACDVAATSLAIIKNSCPSFEIRDIVISGGEPFEDMGIFREVMECVCKIPHENLYINTSLPNTTADAAIDEINNNRKITAVNISRHFGSFYDGFATKDKIMQIAKPVRVNCILGSGWVEKEDLLQYYFEFSPLGHIVFRDNYCDSTSAINGVDNDIVRVFDSVFGYKYSQWGICAHTDYFNHNVELRRTSCHTSFMMGSCRLVNDLIITADGKVLYDWSPSCMLFDKNGNPLPQMYVHVDTSTSSGSVGVWSTSSNSLASAPVYAQLDSPIDPSILSQLNYKEPPTMIGTKP